MQEMGNNCHFRWSIAMRILNALFWHIEYATGWTTAFIYYVVNAINANVPLFLNKFNIRPLIASQEIITSLITPVKQLPVRLKHFYNYEIENTMKYLLPIDSQRKHCILNPFHCYL